ncbi:hypothetical protein Taro_054355, partial [Colocasia esculenta]|nr:hypothetical protein [Colocasia esculenta]
MGVCGFDLIFHYVGVGFEGAAADMTVLRRAIDVGGFTVPQGMLHNSWHLIVANDAISQNTKIVVMPHTGICATSSTISMPNFATVWNVLSTLREGNCYPFRIQVLIVLACCVVHNFIRREHGEDYYFNLRQMDNVEDDDDPPKDPNLVVTPPDMQAGEIELTYSMVMLTKESLTQ